LGGRSAPTAAKGGNKCDTEESLTKLSIMLFLACSSQIMWGGVTTKETASLKGTMWRAFILYRTSFFYYCSVSCIYFFALTSHSCSFYVVFYVVISPIYRLSFGTLNHQLLYLFSCSSTLFLTLTLPNIPHFCTLSSFSTEMPAPWA